MICALWLLQLLQKRRRANTEGRCKSNRTKMENYVTCRTSQLSQEEVSKSGIQERVAPNLHTFCNDCLHKQHTHDYLSASATAPTKNWKNSLNSNPPRKLCMKVTQSSCVPCTSGMRHSLSIHSTGDYKLLPYRFRCR